MKQKTLLVVSIVLTVFVLTILGGVVSTVQGAGKASTATNTQSADLASPDPATLDANIQQTIQAREAAYQDLISQANARLQQMQAEQEALQAQIKALQSQSSDPTSPAQVSPQQAAQIAAQYMGHSDLYSVETTSSNGATVYKVTFSSGNIVLVSLDGQVISVQSAPKASSSTQSRSSSSGGEHENHDQEHEGHDD
jgi:uncharacterized membrane protein